MKKVIFATSLSRHGYGIMCNVDENNQFSSPVFVAVNKVAGENNYSFFLDTDHRHKGSRHSYAEDAWNELKDYFFADSILPVRKEDLKSWFGKEYTEALKLFKENLSDAKREERENKVREELAKESRKEQGGGAWRRAKGGWWNN
ncbi:coil containing protein [Vibrio phage 1.121.O._10N.286.46.C4]|nr:coil containing protein [Vibrio phage 1.121.O._10N.286.46.C4]